MLSLLSIPIGCGSESQQHQFGDDIGESINGTLLAEAKLGGEHVVRFYEMSDGLVTMERLQLSDTPVDFESLKALTYVERFRTLAPSATVPRALYEAEARWSNRPPLTGTEIVPPLATPEERDASTTASPVLGGTIRADTRPSETFSPSAPGFSPGATSLSYIDPNVDAQWWMSNFCSSNNVEDIWCPVNKAWAYGGVRQTMFYDTACLNAAETGTAGCYLDHWNTSTGAWDRWASLTLQPRTGYRWVVETVGWTRSGIAGSLVHYMERYRYSPPVLTDAGAWPYNDAHYWTELLQGITWGSGNWYVVSRTNLMRFALTADLHNYPNLNYPNPWSSTWAHLGAPAYALSKVYVPMEGDPADGGSTSRPAFAVFDTNLAAYGYQRTPIPPAGIPDEQKNPDGSCPWIAYNVLDQKFYSSAFDPNWIYVYDIQVNPVRVTYVRAIRIKDGNGNNMQLKRIQGGAFGDHPFGGRLYLSSDDYADTDGGKVYVMDINNGRVHTYTRIERHTSIGEEVEGLTVFNSAGSGAPGITGQLHVIVIDDVWVGQDDWYFKHLSTSGAL